MHRSAILALVFSMAAATSAYAAPNCSALLSESEGCACAARITPGSPIGQLTVIEGDVRKTGPGEFTPLAPNTQADLNLGDGVVVGDGGDAYLTAGLNCEQRKLDPQTSLVIREVDGCACIALVGSEGTAPLETGDIDGNSGGALLATGLVVGGTTLFFLLNDPVSP